MQVSSVALVGGAGMIAVAAAFTVCALRKRLGWKYLLFGALAWLASVAIKLGLAVLINPPVLAACRQMSEPWASVAVAAYGGLMTGIFEVGGVWLLVRYTRLRHASWENVLAFGIGFGAVEALLLGLASFTTSLIAIFAPEMLPKAALQQLARGSTIAWQLAPIWERFFACLGHIGTNAMIFYTVAQRAPGWFWAAFLYKSFIDAIATAFVVSGSSKNFSRICLMELVTAVWGSIGAIVTHWLGGRYHSIDAGQPDYASGANQPGTA